jgi:hypothetical protein
MNLRLRKLIGTLLLLVLVVVYAFAAMLVAAAVLPQAGMVTQFIFYAVAGVAWTIPAAMLISWMHRSQT